MLRSVIYILVALAFTACKDYAEPKREKKELSEEFKKYWFSGKAEITSYKLEQARYGEVREGTAVLVYVTEDFLPRIQVKANHQDEKNIPVLKLNSTKKFITGIYPYSIMESSFYPVHNNRHALKVSASVQEWCGQVYMQLNNREQFEIISHSYFEGEADKNFTAPQTNLENEIWNIIRIDPSSLPQGETEMIPSFEYLRLQHKPLKPYRVNLNLDTKDSLRIYTINYPDLDRKLKVYFSKDFPYTIEKWEETVKSGFGDNTETITTRTEKMKSLKTAYWKKNRNKDIYLRKKLGLD
ncbi:septum formation inhibitor Maf [Salegentibacter chungangensis]|uniref:Septum formation inhibitor Maf n=1 Tax=Salegentibacter chungangensis TaxID=1335724 RepID=A0ABW3NUC2_9FLAO